jgi:modulator of FtsH protease
VGAAAALTGLLFVAVSINIERILALPALTSRSASTMMLFALPVLVVDPMQRARRVLALGGGLLAGVLCAATCAVYWRRDDPRQPNGRRLNVPGLLAS